MLVCFAFKLTWRSWRPQREEPWRGRWPRLRWRPHCEKCPRKECENRGWLCCRTSPLVTTFRKEILRLWCRSRRDLPAMEAEVVAAGWRPAEGSHRSSRNLRCRKVNFDQKTSCCPRRIFDPWCWAEMRNWKCYYFYYISTWLGLIQTYLTLLEEAELFKYLSSCG